MEYAGPTRLSVVEESQQRIVEIVGDSKRNSRSLSSGADRGRGRHLS